MQDKSLEIMRDGSIIIDKSDVCCWNCWFLDGMIEFEFKLFCVVCVDEVEKELMPVAVFSIWLPFANCISLLQFYKI